jgi:hypothetical protein
MKKSAKKKRPDRRRAEDVRTGYQVFVSHATADKWIARVICEKLEQVGATTFRDDRDIAGGDVHVRGGTVAAVGRGLAAPDAEIIDGAGMLVLPRYVEQFQMLILSTQQFIPLLAEIMGRLDHGVVVPDPSHDKPNGMMILVDRD